MKLLTLLCVSLMTISAHSKTLSCGGTEPFWDAKINLDTGVVKIADPSNLKGTVLKTTITPAAGASTEYAFVAAAKFTSLAVVANENCSDGMSEEKYTHSVIMTGYSRQPFVGCCR